MVSLKTIEKIICFTPGRKLKNTRYCANNPCISITEVVTCLMVLNHKEKAENPLLNRVGKSKY